MFEIEDNVKEIRERIAIACKTANRFPDEVTIIAVTKTFDHEAILAATKEGLFDVGENRVQEMLEKKELIHESVMESLRWHMIGHLQSNKVKYIAPFIHCIHSVDSAALLSEIQKHAAKNERTINIMFEVNVSHEAQKSGMQPAEVLRFAEMASALPNICVTGLMTVAENTDDERTLHEQFATLRRVRDDVQNEHFPNVPAAELSMGMSHDFEIAIAEGATMVRLGTALFGSRTNVTLPA